MSAYLVDTDVIDLLATACDRYGLNVYGTGCVRVPGGVDRLNGRTDTARIAQVLWDENIYSVSARYRGESFDTLPGPIARSRVFSYRRVDLDAAAAGVPAVAVLVLSQIPHYEYQACESSDWRDSYAFRIIDHLRQAAIRELRDAYELPWGWTREWAADRLAEKRAAVVNQLAHGRAH